MSLGGLYPGDAGYLEAMRSAIATMRAQTEDRKKLKGGTKKDRPEHRVSGAPARAHTPAPTEDPIP